MPAIIIGFILVFIIGVLQWVWYGMVSLGYFIADYWLISLAIFFGMGIFSGENARQKVGFGAVTVLFLLFHYGDSLYITDSERASVKVKATEIAEFYNKVGFNASVINGSEVICAVRIPISLPDISAYMDSFEITNEKALERFLGPKKENYDVYRALELEIREFHENGGDLHFIIQNRSGQSVFKVIQEDMYNYSIVSI